MNKLFCCVDCFNEQLGETAWHEEMAGVPAAEGQESIDSRESSYWDELKTASIERRSFTWSDNSISDFKTPS